MFKSKKQKAASAANKAFTLTGLLKAAVAHDQEAMMKMATGQTADDEGIVYALTTLVEVAHRNPGVIARLRELQPTMPDNAQVAFTSGIACAQAGNLRAFQGGSLVGQATFIMALAAATSEDDHALADAMATVKVFAERGGR